ncbi:MAG: helix-turn-helix transcriptional regulator [Gloeomargaritaceae cyanobacterium C42_A2020_066]|nr:helix-turn-helix transcriptional regulator [Gloeomargaritaceae cyanobacterium C42_A2020_066]
MNSHCGDTAGRVGSRIREARLAAGLTQSALAELLGVSRTSVINWEMGRALPSFSHLVRLREVLGLPWWELAA